MISRDPAPILYQFLHPWHWLTYGQNAAGIGFLVLVAYTLYTRNMMRTAEKTRRAVLEPVLALSGLGRWEDKVTIHPTGQEVLRIRNVGQGAALALKAWRERPDPTFQVGLRTLYTPTPLAIPFASLAQTIVKDEVREIFTTPFWNDSCWLVIVECRDQLNRRHQMQLFKSPNMRDEYLQQWVSKPGDSFGERLIVGVRGWKEVLKALEKEVEDIEPASTSRVSHKLGTTD